MQYIQLEYNRAPGSNDASFGRTFLYNTAGDQYVIKLTYVHIYRMEGTIELGGLRENITIESNSAMYEGSSYGWEKSFDHINYSDEYSAFQSINSPYGILKITIPDNIPIGKITMTPRYTGDEPIYGGRLIFTNKNGKIISSGDTFWNDATIMKRHSIEIPYVSYRLYDQITKKYYGVTENSELVENESFYISLQQAMVYLNQFKNKNDLSLTTEDYDSDEFAITKGFNKSSFIKSKGYVNILDLAKKVDFFNIIGKCKIVFQENDTLVWKAFDTEGDKISLVKTNTDDGFNEEVLEKGNDNLNTFIDKFNDLKNIKFGFLLENDKSEIDKIQMNFDAHGAFKILEPIVDINRTNLQISINKTVKLLKTNILINQ